MTDPRTPPPDPTPPEFRDPDDVTLDGMLKVLDELEAEEAAGTPAPDRPEDE